MKTIRHSVLLFCAALLPLFLATGCPTTQRTLDPAGAYQGDKILYALDGAITETAAVFKDVIALADRNPAAVASNPKLAEGVAKIRAELDGVPQPSETLVKLFAARDAYVAARTATNAQHAQEATATARTVLETARTLLPLFIQPSQP